MEMCGLFFLKLFLIFPIIGHILLSCIIIIWLIILVMPILHKGVKKQSIFKG